MDNIADSRRLIHLQIVESEAVKFLKEGPSDALEKT
jgi:hypothetical protein